MITRKGRSGKTSDRMAVYKANASRSIERRASVPVRVSPSTSPKKRCSPGGENDVTPALGVAGRDLSHDKRGGHTGATHAHFDDLEEIPETPPRPTRASGKKRVLAPRRETQLGSHGAESDSGDESDKPSKKRKTFKTPPRGQGSSARMRDVLMASNRNATFSATPPKTTDSEPGSDSGMLEISEVGDSPCAERSLTVPNGRKDGCSRKQNHADREKSVVYRRDVLLSRTNGKRTGVDSEGEPEEQDDLNVLQVSSATVARLLEVFGLKLKSEFVVMQKANIEEMRRIADTVNNLVSSQMQHMEGRLSMATRGMAGSRAQKSTGKTNLTEWEQKLNSLTADVELIFNKDVFSRILCFNTSVKAASVYRDHEGTDLEKAALSAQTLLFSLQPGERKFSFSGKIGALHSEFKFTIVQNSFFNVSRNAFGFFSENDEKSQDKAHSTTTYDSHAISNRRLSVSVSAASKCIKRPTWLEGGKVNSDHINEARGFLERANQSRKSKIRRTPGPDDIAIHAALRVYRLLGNYLHVRRGAVRNKFFHGLGYLLVRWSDHVKDNNQEDLNMSWKSGDSGLRLRLDSVSHTEQCTINADDAAITAVDASNKSLIRSLFSKFPEMVLAVKHQIHVVNGSGTQRRHAGGDRETIHRLINLIDVASDLCVEYCGVTSVEVFLRTHRHSLQTVMILAFLVKAFCVKVMEYRDGENSRSAQHDRSGTSSLDIEVGVMKLKDLIPGPSMQKNLLECRCLRMTRAEFDMFNHCVDGEEEVQYEGENGKDELGMVDIRESEEMGIGMI